MKFKSAVLTTMGLLALSGCAASHEGPPARAVKLAYVENASGRYDLKHFPRLWKEVEPRMVVSHCKKDSAPGVWTCEVYIQDKNGPHLMSEVQVVQEGGVWKDYQQP